MLVRPAIDSDSNPGAGRARLANYPVAKGTEKLNVTVVAGDRPLPYKKGAA